MGHVALDGAAEMFTMGVDQKMTPEEFVTYWKKKNTNIQGIGHRVKSIHNPDARVTIVKNYVEKHFKKHPVYDFSLEVEKVTTAKRDNLILNVDGIIGIAFADMLRTELGKKEADEYIKMGALNALFVLGRGFGFVGHHLDQKRLKQGLYRHPWDDIAYMTENKK